MLSKLAGLEETDVGMMQLIYSVSPTICRPLTCSYMSLRHKEDLNKIRPVVLFLTEHFQELFTFAKSFRVDGFGSGNSFQASIGHDKTDLISEMMTSAMVIDTTPTNHPEKGLSSMETYSDEEGNGAFGLFLRPNLMLSIPPAISTSASLEGTSMDDSDALNQSAGNLSGSSVQHSDHEWKVFHALVFHNTARFFQLDDKETSQLLANECGSDGHHAVMQAWTAKLSIPSPLRSSSSSSDNSNSNGTLNSQLPPSSSSSSPANSHSLMMKVKAGSPMSKSIGRRNRRRKMVSECKALRSIIQEFEQDFLKKHNRVPKAQERGLMHATYIKYRDMKKEIRETAATDMTRLVRGFLARRLFARGMFMSSTSDDQHPHHVSSSSSLKIGSSNSLHLAAQSLSINGSSNSNNNIILDSDEISKFRDLVSSKRELKRTLKKFDADFQATHNRAPRKADKEAMRPLYQKYQEIKNSLEILRMALQTYDNLPEDVRVELLSPGASTPMVAGSGGGGGGSVGWEQKRPSSYSGSFTDSEAEHDEHENANTTKRNRLNTNGQSSATASDVSAASTVTVSPMTTPVNTRSAVAAPTLDELQIEKRNLHEYLKVYERLALSLLFCFV